MIIFVDGYGEMDGEAFFNEFIAPCLSIGPAYYRNHNLFAEEFWEEFFDLFIEKFWEKFIEEDDGRLSAKGLSRDAATSLAEEFVYETAKRQFEELREAFRKWSLERISAEAKRVGNKIVSAAGKPVMRKQSGPEEEKGWCERPGAQIIDRNALYELIQNFLNGRDLGRLDRPIGQAVGCSLLDDTDPDAFAEHLKKGGRPSKTLWLRRIWFDLYIGWPDLFEENQKGWHPNNFAPDIKHYEGGDSEEVAISKMNPAGRAFYLIAKAVRPDFTVDEFKRFSTQMRAKGAVVVEVIENKGRRTSRG